MNTPRAVLDACVLVPYNLASLLLTLADHGLLEPRWSATILEEMTRALTTKIGLDEQAAVRRRNAMEDAFPEAKVADFELHIPGLGCHPKDRHVLAAAIASDADIVTFNVRDFPAAACEPHGVIAKHPEEYLLELLASAREATLTAIEADAARRTHPSTNPADLLGRLAATVPTFANLANQTMHDEGPFSDFPAYVAVDPTDSPLGSLADNPDLTDPLHVAILWWSALLNLDQESQQLRALTYAPEAWGDFRSAANLLSGKSLASKVYYAVDCPDSVAIVRFVPEVAATAQTFASFTVRGMVFLTLCRQDDGTWRAWGLGPRLLPTRDIVE